MQVLRALEPFSPTPVFCYYCQKPILYLDYCEFNEIIPNHDSVGLTCVLGSFSVHGALGRSGPSLPTKLWLLWVSLVGRLPGARVGASRAHCTRRVVGVGGVRLLHVDGVSLRRVAGGRVTLGRVSLGWVARGRRALARVRRGLLKIHLWVGRSPDWEEGSVTKHTHTTYIQMETGSIGMCCEDELVMNLSELTGRQRCFYIASYEREPKWMSYHRDSIQMNTVYLPSPQFAQ